ncbi:MULTISPECIES: ATP-binding cassette domain-containing protein [Ensifer]|jgi:putative ABC transport system ATP-binding protein|uniref:ATP-binding cassette domain-containing protein n=1 Tax=Ensifer canadensis TaxID=555315 RepID=A0AAW4FVB7_9HYPH|nr:MULTISPECIES: ATP-binding cassette domain-containing protein [Ensifer]AHK42819.1 putative ABC transporter, ATP-binding protein [Ensifer adhaerens OV14]MDP9632807.1 putative ABC transport system ATP-binding protein [Ensifer adhaerens]KQU92649.1 ABC transporter [Ensifer sp. Root31]KQW50133.1 ABC transporter [Ensifer sp. Root1252]KQW67577.1 ABC transporter [Ensifer sp. Root127]
MLGLQLAGVDVSFPGLAAPALAIDSLDVAAGSRVALTGASGSGKSTLISILTGLERVGQGRILWGDVDICALSEGRRDRWCGANIGLVLQDFHLFPGLSALDNVLLPTRLSGAMSRDVGARAEHLLLRVGLTRPTQMIETMSRGEMQRVAIARALLRKPGVVIADEPTASLDSDAGETVGDLLLELSRESGCTLIVATHDLALTRRMDRRIRLAAGRIVEDGLIEERAA